MRVIARIAFMLFVVGSVVAAAATAAPKKTVRPAAGTPLKVFVQSTINTPVFNIPDVQYATAAAAAAINKNGGIKGHPIQIVFCSDQNDPNMKISCARDAISQGVVAYVGGHSSNGYYPLFRDAGIPIIGTSGGVVDFVSPIQFPLNGGSVTSFMALPFALKKAGAKKLAIISNDVPQSLAFVPLIQAAAKKAGLQFVGLIKQPGSLLPDYSPQAQKVKDLGADSVVFLTNYVIAGAEMRAINAVGVPVKYAITNLTVGDAEAKAIGDAANGMIIAGTLPPSSSTNIPGIKLFNQQLDAIGAPQDFRRLFGVNSWTAFYAFKAVADSIKGPITAKSILHALRTWPKNKPINVQGLVKWVPSQAGPTAFPRIGSGLTYLETVKNDVVVLSSTKPFDVFKAMGIKLPK
jgi:ABC-type branched-subunit amino acid transport system substrate-binding protein